MALNSVIFCFVARVQGPVVLVGRVPASAPRNLKDIAFECLQKLSEANLEEKKLIYAVEGYTLLFLLEDGYVYSVVAHNRDANSAAKQEKFFGLLSQLMKEFCARYGAGLGGVADTAREHELDEDFDPQLRRLISAFHGENPNSMGDDKAAKVSAQVQEVKSVMMNNIKGVINRGDDIDVIVHKTENLRNQADQFQTQNTQLRRKLQWKNYKTTMIVIAMIIVLILIIFFWACHGVKCTK